MDTHLTFNVAVILFCTTLIALIIPNIYYFENLHSNGGSQSVNKHSSLIMIIANITGLLLVFGILVWAIIRVFSTETTQSSSSYNAMY
jgi:hypothetical protein